MNTRHEGRLLADARVHCTVGTLRVGEFVAELMQAYPERIEQRDKHGTLVESITVPRERAADVTSITSDGQARATPVVYALRSRYAGTMLRLRTASGIGHTVSPEHPLYALRDKVEYLPADQIRVGDWLPAPRPLVLDATSTAEDDQNSYWAGLLT